MTIEEITAIEATYPESKIQHICVSWFRTTFPDIGYLLFAVPNGGWRGARAGAKMVYEGAVRGVPDLIFQHENGTLYIEMKVPKRKGRSAGKQSVFQRDWQLLVEDHGGIYVICHGIIEFASAVCRHMGHYPSPYIRDILNRYPLYR